MTNAEAAEISLRQFIDSSWFKALHRLAIIAIPLVGTWIGVSLQQMNNRITVVVSDLSSTKLQVSEIKGIVQVLQARQATVPASLPVRAELMVPVPPAGTR